MHVVILGNGIAGVSAAQSIRRLQPGWKITLVSGELKYPFSRPALMYIYMGQMPYANTKLYEDEYWNQQRIELLRAWVTRIDTAQKRLELHDAPALSYDKLLITTGSKSNRFGWPGQDLEGVQSLYGLMDLALLQENTKGCRNAVIVGGGLIGIEMAEMMHSQGIHVTFLVRESSYWNNILPDGESEMINEIIRAHGFGLKLSTGLERIEDDGKGRACAVVTDKGERIECQLVALTAGVSPNLDVVKDSQIATGRGILVSSDFSSSVPEIHAAGDCAEIITEDEGRNLIQQVWYTAKQQGSIAGEVIAGQSKNYEPGIWYNSAKFLDLEYQTYGRVGFHVPGEASVFWKHSDGRHAIRVVHVDGRLIGLNFMGIRFRHEVARQWIADGRSAEYALDHLAQGHFDPEFFTRYEAEAVASLRQGLGQETVR